MSGFGGMGNMFDFMKNAKGMMEKAKTAQAELAGQRVEGSAGAGLVTATMNGAGELVGLRLEKVAVNPDDVEMLADLIVAAVADGKRKADGLRQEMLAKIAGGVDLSALGLDKAGLF